MQRRGDEGAPALLDALLEGRARPGAGERAATGLGLPERGRYAVAVLRAGQPERARGVRDVNGMRFWWRTRADREIAVVGLGDRGLSELTAVLTGRCTGPGGISPVVEGLAELDRARRLAEAALLTCVAGSTRIVRVEERLTTVLLVGQPDLSARLVTDVLGPLLDLDPAERGLLLVTLEAWLECGGSAGRAAGQLFCHRNTVFNRLRRLEALTSRSLSRPRELIEMTLALDAFRLTGVR